MEKDAIIEAENICKVFNFGMPNEVKAIWNTSMKIHKGQMVVLYGPSGSGKTTLLSLIGCMLRPTEGSILIKGRDISKLPEKFLTELRRTTFGFIFQHFNLIKGITALNNVMLPLFPLNRNLLEIKNTAESIIEHFGISHRKFLNIQNLSGGEQQRVAICRALINNPEIIIADEPTAHLDTKLAKDLILIFTQLKREGKTVVIATHDPIIYDQDIVDVIIEVRDGSARMANPNSDGGTL